MDHARQHNDDVAHPGRPPRRPHCHRGDGAGSERARPLALCASTRLQAGGAGDDDQARRPGAVILKPTMRHETAHEWGTRCCACRLRRNHMSVLRTTLAAVFTLGLIAITCPAQPSPCGVATQGLMIYGAFPKTGARVVRNTDI